MKSAIVSSAELLGSGAPLTAEYWVNRHNGESYDTWLRRMGVAQELGKARRAISRAEKNIARATELLSEEAKKS